MNIPTQPSHLHKQDLKSEPVPFIVRLTLPPLVPEHCPQQSPPCLGWFKGLPFLVLP